MAITIRRLGPGDEQILETLARDAPEFDLPGLSEPDEPMSPGAAAEYLSSWWAVHWVAEEDDRVVGELLCHVLPLSYGAGKELLLYSIGVRQNERRRGIGRALVETMFAWMRDTGIPFVWVLADNPGAEAFYEACGFTLGEGRDQGTLMIRSIP
jgi:GNAT superfamily N-acetyltransferase